jgi:hypothetical protein
MSTTDKVILDVMDILAGTEVLQAMAMIYAILED